MDNKILYDPLKELASLVNEETSRTGLQGAIIVGAVYDLSGGDAVRARKNPSENAKRDIVVVIRTELEETIKDIRCSRQDNVEEIQRYCKAAIKQAAEECTLKYLDFDIVRSSYNLFSIVLKLARFGKDKPRIFQEFGRTVESKICDLYQSHTVPLEQSNRSERDVGRARVEEYNFLTRILHTQY